MSLMTLNHLRKKAQLSTSYYYLNTILTTIDHLRSKNYIHSLTQTKLDIRCHLKKIQKEGYSVINYFIDKEHCKQYRETIDDLIHQYPEYIHKNTDDQRIYGAENVSSKIKIFSKNPFLQQIASSYNQTVTHTAFTLAAKLPYTLNNLGSGGGWHRDSCIKQFKAILYLSDVTEKNGPFQLIQKSNNLIYKILDNKRANQPYMAYRYTNTQVNNILSKTPDRLITFCAPAGTLILVDTSCLHRGKPIEEGDRYALFNYYYPENVINDALLKQFAPLAQKT